jgi:aryl-alcohol dehydrogenase-like predicted oxidoreductase
MAHRKNRTTTQLAIAWVLSRGEDIVPLVGMSRPERLAENLRAFDVALSREDLDDLDRTFALVAITGDRYPAQFKHLAAK